MDGPTVWYASVIGVAFVPTLAAILYAFWCLRLRRRLENMKPFAALPMPGPSHWLFGHFFLLQGDFREGQRRMVDSANEYGQTSYWLGNTRTVAVIHWQDVRAILHAEYERSHLPLVTKHLNKLLGAKNIGLLQGREWKVHRAAIVRSFSPVALTKSKCDMVEVTHTLVESLRERIPIGGLSSTRLRR
jgi:cytochrome P450